MIFIQKIPLPLQNIGYLVLVVNVLRSNGSHFLTRFCPSDSLWPIRRKWSRLTWIPSGKFSPYRFARCVMGIMTGPSGWNALIITKMEGRQKKSFHMYHNHLNAFLILSLLYYFYSLTAIALLVRFRQQYVSSVRAPDQPQHLMWGKDCLFWFHAIRILSVDIFFYGKPDYSFESYMIKLNVTGN